MFREVLAVVLGFFVAIYAFFTITGQTNAGGNAIDYLLRVAYVGLLFFVVYKIWPRAKEASTPESDEGL